VTTQHVRTRPVFTNYSNFLFIHYKKKFIQNSLATFWKERGFNCEFRQLETSKINFRVNGQDKARESFGYMVRLSLSQN